MSTTGLATELVLYAGCLPATPYRSYVDAAAEAGFDAITMWPLIHRRAQTREGLDPATMRAIADDAGIHISDLDPVGDWLPPADDPDAPAMFKSVWSRQQFLDCATALGVQRLTAVQLTPDPAPHEVAVEGFAALCDDAAAHGLGVQLEFMPFSGVPDLASALRILRDAGRSNAGLVLDLSHFVRSGGSVDELDGIPDGLVTAIQLSDGAAAPPADLRDEAMFHRLLPGAGQLQLAALVGRLTANGTRCGAGPELYQRGWSDRDPFEVARDLMEATRRVV